jgi:type IV secretion system protein VirD4
MTSSARRWALAAAPALVVLALAAATQVTGLCAHYPREFGGGVVDLGGQRLYAPWAIVDWYRRYAAAFPRLFTIALLAGLAVLTGPCLALAMASRRFTAQPKPFGSSAWGDVAEARRAGLVRPDGRVVGRVLGRLGRHVLTFGGDEHVMVIGASRAGKGVGHVVPSLLAWPHSVMVYDRKGELWHITADHRRRFSHTFFFAPTDSNTARWNPLFEVRRGPTEVADVQNIVGILVDPIGKRQGHLDFWDQSAANFFTALILHVLYTAPNEAKTLSEVRRRLIDIEPTLDAMLETQHRWRLDSTMADGLARDDRGEPIGETHPEVWLGAKALRNMEPRVRSSVLATAQKSLALWADPMVAHATSWSDFCIGDLACAASPVSFYLITPQAHADRLAFLVRVMLRQSLGSLMERTDRDSRGRPKLHRLLMMLDEFPKLGSLPFLENALGEMAGYGVSAHLICQSFNDVISRYGVHSSIFDNVHITAAFATSEPDSIGRIVKRAGKALEMRESFTDPRRWFDRGHRSRSQHEVERYVLGEQDVRALGADKQFLFVNGVKPIMARKLRYFADAPFRRWGRNFFGGARAAHQQTPQTLDTAGPPPIDWLGVTAVAPYSPPLRPAEPDPRPEPVRLSLAVLDINPEVD